MKVKTISETKIYTCTVQNFANTHQGPPPPPPPATSHIVMNELIN
jgi:hypothetical protein